MTSDTVEPVPDDDDPAMTNGGVDARAYRGELRNPA
jgi:hypothetical protein